MTQQPTTYTPVPPQMSPDMAPAPAPAAPGMPVQAMPHAVGQPQPGMAPPIAQPVAPMQPQQGTPVAPPMPQAAPVPPAAGMPAMAPAMPAAMPHAQVAPPYQQPEIDPVSDGGEKALPNIAIQAFCERSETAGVIHETTRDWRMKRANMKIFMGGLPAAIEYYHKESTPNLIIIESGMRGSELFAQLEQLASVCDEDTRVIMIGAANDIKLYRQLIEKGVSEYIVPPFHPLSLIRSMSELYNDPEKPFIGRVAAFFGAKGGVGSSTLAHNVAWCMSQVLGHETALVDLDASWGTTGLDFAYDAAQGLEEALSQPDRLDETLLDRIMLRHTEKLSILPTSGSLSSRPNMSPEAYETVVNGVRAISPMTILDMPHYWAEWTTSVLTNVDDIIITCVPDLANLRNTKNLVDFLKAERPNDVPPILILNKTGRSKTSEISVKDFGAAVGLDPALVIGFDPDTFIEAANDGKMLTDVKNTAQTVEGLNYIANRLKTGKYNAGFNSGPRTKGLSLLNKKTAKEAPVGGKEKTSLLSRFKKRK